MAKVSVRDLDVRGKRVLVRVDFNVPTEVRGGKIRVTDDTRIRESLPTINYLREHGAKTILMSHFGRPKGRDAKQSLKPIAAALSEVLGRPVTFAEDCIGEAAAKAVASMKEGDILLLENTRFNAGEEKNDSGFAKALATLGDVYVNDAFSAAHRAHASTEGLAHVLPAYAGRAMQAELDALAKGLEAPARPLVVAGLVMADGKVDLDGNGAIQARTGARTGDTGVADLASLTGAVGNGDCLLGGDGPSAAQGGVLRRLPFHRLPDGQVRRGEPEGDLRRARPLPRRRLRHRRPP
jgi:phosphoglycerate kinase